MRVGACACVYACVYACVRVCAGSDINYLQYEFVKSTEEMRGVVASSDKSAGTPSSHEFNQAREHVVQQRTSVRTDTHKPWTRTGWRH